MKSIRTLLAVSALSAAAGAFAAPMPNSIVLEGKAVVPVLKTEVIRKVQGQEPVRSVEATVFEVSNQGKDIVAREIQLQDNQGQFSDRQLAIPVLKQGSVIVPTSKIELNKTLKQDGQIISQTRKLDAWMRKAWSLKKARSRSSARCSWIRPKRLKAASSCRMQC